MTPTSVAPIDSARSEFALRRAPRRGRRGRARRPARAASASSSSSSAAAMSRTASAPMIRASHTSAGDTVKSLRSTGTRHRRPRPREVVGRPAEELHVGEHREAGRPTGLVAATRARRVEVDARGHPWTATAASPRRSRRGGLSPTKADGEPADRARRPLAPRRADASNGRGRRPRPRPGARRGSGRGRSPARLLVIAAAAHEDDRQHDEHRAGHRDPDERRGAAAGAPAGPGRRIRPQPRPANTRDRQDHQRVVTASSPAGERLVGRKLVGLVAPRLEVLHPAGVVGARMPARSRWPARPDRRPWSARGMPCRGGRPRRSGDGGPGRPAPPMPRSPRPSCAGRGPGWRRRRSTWRSGWCRRARRR